MLLWTVACLVVQNELAIFKWVNAEHINRNLFKAKVYWRVFSNEYYLCGGISVKYHFYFMASWRRFFSVFSSMTFWYDVDGTLKLNVCGVQKANLVFRTLGHWC